MQITCENCEKELIKQLGNVPKAWRDKIANAICTQVKDVNAVSCEDVKECETLTSFSDFVVDGTSVCITYKDEQGVQVERCFDFADIINHSLDALDPKCMADGSTWGGWNFTERMQAIVDKVCTTCEDAPITTSTTSTSTSTTTTTTAVPCAAVTEVGIIAITTTTTLPPPPTTTTTTTSTTTTTTAAPTTTTSTSTTTTTTQDISGWANLELNSAVVGNDITVHVTPAFGTMTMYHMGNPDTIKTFPNIFQPGVSYTVEVHVIPVGSSTRATSLTVFNDTTTFDFCGCNDMTINNLQTSTKVTVFTGIA